MLLTLVESPMNRWIIPVAGLALLFREHADNDAQDLVDIPIQALCTRENRARFSLSLLVPVHTTSPQVLSCVQSPGRKPGLIAARGIRGVVRTGEIDLENCSQKFSIPATAGFD